MCYHKKIAALNEHETLKKRRVEQVLEIHENYRNPQKNQVEFINHTSFYGLNSTHVMYAG